MNGGRDFIEHAIRIDDQRGDLGLHGWVAEPRFNRAQADRQFFFVNGRAVRDRLVAHAVRSGFQDVLYHGRHPAFVLFLELPPQAVDVNVHPQKQEVRFRDGRTVHDFLYASLHRALAGAGAESGSVLGGVAGGGHGGGLGAGALRPGAGLVERGGSPLAGWGAQAGMALPVGEQVSAYASVLGVAPANVFSPTPASMSEHSGEAAAAPPLGYALAQLHGVYILSQNDQGLSLPGLDALSTPTLNLLVAPPGTLSAEEATQAALTPLVEQPAPRGMSGCIPGQILIESPESGTSVSGTVTLNGTASIPNFGFYKYEVSLHGIKPMGNDRRRRYARHTGPAGRLGYFHACEWGLFFAIGHHR